MAQCQTFSYHQLMHVAWYLKHPRVSSLLAALYSVLAVPRIISDLVVSWEWEGFTNMHVRMSCHKNVNWCWSGARKHGSEPGGQLASTGPSVYRPEREWEEVKETFVKPRTDDNAQRKRHQQKAAALTGLQVFCQKGQEAAADLKRMSHLQHNPDVWQGVHSKWSLCDGYPRVVNMTSFPNTAYVNMTYFPGIVRKMGQWFVSMMSCPLAADRKSYIWCDDMN